MYCAHYPLTHLMIKPLLSLLLVVILGYPIGLKSAHGSRQNIRELQLLDIERETLSIVDSDNNNNSFCDRYREPFFIFYSYVLMPFMEEHRASQFNNVTQEHIDSLKAQLGLAQHSWSSCISHSEEISDPSQLAYRIYEDNFDFLIGTLREHGIEGEALDTLKDIFELRRDILSSDDIRCQRSINESYISITARYNLGSILRINREERASIITERGRTDFNMAKTEWENCTNN